jgi:hypothetical protein
MTALMEGTKAKASLEMLLGVYDVKKTVTGAKPLCHLLM